mmetsp:Transcript_13962/g.26337  ORF Transcript_13962/g.26337 Transcript_13962/m.26337 type:complete len:335 (+) Transcript_13962:1225-2229(+)
MNVRGGAVLGDGIVLGKAGALRDLRLPKRPYIFARHSQTVERVLQISQKLQVLGSVVRPVDQSLLESSEHGRPTAAHLRDDRPRVQPDAVRVVLVHGLEQHLKEWYGHPGDHPVSDRPELAGRVGPGPTSVGEGSDALHLHKQLLQFRVHVRLPRSRVDRPELLRGLLRHRVQPVPLLASRSLIVSDPKRHELLERVRSVPVVGQPGRFRIDTLDAERGAVLDAVVQFVRRVHPQVEGACGLGGKGPLLLLEQVLHDAVRVGQVFVGAVAVASGQSVHVRREGRFSVELAGGGGRAESRQRSHLGQSIAVLVVHGRIFPGEVYVASVVVLALLQ